MQYSDDRYHLRVEFEHKDCQLPSDELGRMQRSLEPLGEALADFPASQLWVSPHLAFRGLSHNQHAFTEPTHSRFLELADIALGLKQPEPLAKIRKNNVEKNTETTNPRLIPESEQASPVLLMDDASKKFCCPVCKAKFARNASDAMALFRVHQCSRASAA